MAGGRPTVFDDITLKKLEDAFANDATDVQACFLANISPASLYNYQKEHPGFLERKNALKAMTAYQAKKNIKDKIMEGDTEKSMWYVERKEKNEGFSTRQEVTGAEGKNLIPGKAEQEIAEEAITTFLYGKNTTDTSEGDGGSEESTV